MNLKADRAGHDGIPRFVDGTGLSSGNVSTAQDLGKLVTAAYQISADPRQSLNRHTGLHRAGRTNAVACMELSQYQWVDDPVRNGNIELSKTGYIS